MEWISEIPLALWIAGILALYMAWAIGANDVANAMGTSVGSGALTVGGAIIVAAVLEFAGAFLAGGHVTDTVRKGMLDLSMMTREQLVYGMLGSLAAAGTLLVVATRFGLPISTTHSIVGAIVGFGAIAVGLDAVKWGKIAQIVLSWVTSPLLAGVIAFFIFQITRIKVLDKPDPVAQIRKLGPVFLFFVFFIIGLVTLFKGLKPLKLDLNLTQSLIGSVALGLIGTAI
ncbi:MAG: inorganic phosphate transporter, partial [Pseudomonadota bacterium]|nr:inorganic phosphate transporter [Pseudomonadota bacterium]